MFYCKKHNSQTPWTENIEKTSKLYTEQTDFSVLGYISDRNCRGNGRGGKNKKTPCLIEVMHGVFCIWNPKGLLPLDGRVWLRREVVAYAVYSRDLCEDTVGDLLENRPVDLFDGSCHRVDGVHGADDHRPVV